LCWRLLAVLFVSLGVGTHAADVAYLANEHVDFKILYSPASDELSLVIRNEDESRNIAITNVYLVVREQARTELPPGTPFGEAGDLLWILPQSQDTSLLYAGFSAENLTPGAFEGALDIQFIRIED